MRRRDLVAIISGGCAFYGSIAAVVQAAEAPLVALLDIKSIATESRIAAFERNLRSLGWTGTNIRIERRIVEPGQDQLRAAAAEIIDLAPAVVLAHTTLAVSALLQASRTIPVVFVHLSDPAGSGIVASLAHPGGNATGFTDFEPSLGGKWLQLLKEVAPAVTHAGLLYNPETAPRRGEVFLAPYNAAAASLGIEAVPVKVHDVEHLEQALTALPRPGSGIVVASDSFNVSHFGEIVALAARLRLPALYTGRPAVELGGLLSYGIDSVDLYRRAATYVDRILRGERPAELPVQQPTKFELVINLKTAKALGLIVPQALLARADEVIE